MAKRKNKRTKKRKPQKQARQVKQVSSYFYDKMEKVQYLLSQRDWVTAREELLSLHDDYPTNTDVLIDLINISYELNDVRSYQLFCEKLLKYDPDNPDIAYGVSGAYMTNMYPGLALQGFQDYLRRYPDHDHVDKANEAIDRLIGALASDLKQFEPYGDPIDIAADYDRIRLNMERANYQTVYSVANRLLKINPSFVPVLNNLSIADLSQGKFKHASLHLQKALSIEPDNFQAIANMVRSYAMQGQFEAARKEAEKLNALEDDSADFLAKKTEVLSYIGDDEAILETYYQAEAAGYTEKFLPSAIYHFTAVAAIRCGQEALGLELWDKITGQGIPFTVIHQNLEDIKKPINERHGPWAFQINNWLSDKIVAEVRASFGNSDDLNESHVERGLRRILRKYPHILNLLPMMLERGDPLSREFAYDMIRLIKSDALLAHLPDFAMGPYGPHRMRYEALQLAQEHGLLPKQNKFWVNGKQTEVILYNYKIYDSPKFTHPPDVAKLAQEAAIALRIHEGAMAERLLKQAIELLPNVPDLQNNLAMAYRIQGRSDEAYELIMQTHKNHPDYLFSRVAVSEFYVEDGKIEAANELLYPLMERDEYHIAEFSALAGAYIYLYLAWDKPEAAQHWLNMWEQYESPESQELESWRQRIKKYQSKTSSPKKPSKQRRRKESAETSSKKFDLRKLLGL
ncbi:hypothetical protein QUF64_08185 [Anaerolineales bacterium HSG6]|nr:hypothetical protein [Anaerolineales bacterium HSG6]MDM8531875.1 hypothetical protein [Anaerolineales bacterium HSG25]